MKYIFTVSGNTLLVNTNTEGGTYPLETFSYKVPTPTLGDDIIILNEGATLKQTFRFHEIETIGGDVPTDLQDAYNKLITLVENFNKGGATPKTFVSISNDAYAFTAENKNNIVLLGSDNSINPYISPTIDDSLFAIGDEIEFIANSEDKKVLFDNVSGILNPTAQPYFSFYYLDRVVLKKIEANIWVVQNTNFSNQLKLAVYTFTGQDNAFFINLKEIYNTTSVPMFTFDGASGGGAFTISEFDETIHGIFSVFAKRKSLTKFEHIGTTSFQTTEADSPSSSAFNSGGQITIIEY